MAGGNISAAQAVGPLLEHSEFDGGVAIDTGVGSASRQVGLHKRLYDGLVELLAHIGHMVLYAETLGKKSRLVRSSHRGITCEQREPHNIVTRRQQHTACGCTINTTAHSKQHFLFRHIHTCFTIAKIPLFDEIVIFADEISE